MHAQHAYTRMRACANTQVRLLPAANVVNAARTSLASDTSASVVGSWGDRPGPFPTYLVADGGSGADAIYSAGDTISISFSEPTDSGGVPIGQPLADETLEALLACHLLDDETLDGEQTPFPLSSFGQLSTEWTSPSVLTLTVVDAATASTLLTVPSYTGLGVPSMLGQLACCIRPDGLIRKRGPAYAHTCTPTHTHARACTHTRMLVHACTCAHLRMLRMCTCGWQDGLIRRRGC